MYVATVPVPPPHYLTVTPPYRLLLLESLPLTLCKVLQFFQLACLKAMEGERKVGDTHNRRDICTNSIRGMPLPSPVSPPG